MDSKALSKFVDLADLSRQLGLPSGWLKTEAIAGRIPCLRISPRKLLFSVDAVHAALLDRAASASPKVDR